MEKKDIDRLWNNIILAAQIQAKVENDSNSLEWVNELRSDITDYFKDKKPKEEFIYIVSFFRTVYKFNLDSFLKSSYDFKEMDLEIEITKLEQKRILANLSEIIKTPKLDLYIEYLKNAKKINVIQPTPPGTIKNNLLTVKTLLELESLIWGLKTSIEDFKELNIEPTGKSINFEIDFFNLKRNIFNETLEFEKLSTKLKNHKVKELISFSEICWEIAVYLGKKGRELDEIELINSGYEFLAVHAVLLDSINLLKSKEPEQIENNLLNDFPEIFAINGFQTFKMLDEKYKKDNKNLRAKYSNLYRFLDYKELLKCTQLEYIDFIHENYSVKLSKILPKTTKYEDIIQPLLMRYLTGQQ